VVRVDGHWGCFNLVDDQMISAMPQHRSYVGTSTDKFNRNLVTLYIDSITDMVNVTLRSMLVL
jgi:hypothetical protein